MCIRSDRESDSDAEDLEHAEKLRQVKAVLEEVFFFGPKAFSYPMLLLGIAITTTTCM